MEIIELETTVTESSVDGLSRIMEVTEEKVIELEEQ